ncbi:molybdenum cofactor guanylyltransferase [Glaciecola sp. MH2013]|uniref:molybdenum cofactor guanylyltransferase n=1 Tax=Glaciecola sp. MH2013 TaxID=2785524 RepID=UPI0018A110FE|nr:molybdenum cofactor guanylyltransferase [Glaciecola sp. MH2013]MBF7073057.1 molybdenum cofactor guanylyltransferase [Glaciecola sp. MH2013]
MSQSKKTQSRVVGLVLNGGHSTRMGRPKGEVIYHGVSFLEHAIRCLQQTTIEQLYVGLKDKKPIQGENNDTSRSTLLSRENIQLCYDEFGDKGPVGGILSAIEHAELQVGDILLVIPNDMPKLRSQYLEALLEHARCKLQSCYFESNYFPVAFYLSNENIALLKTVKSANSVSMRYVLSGAISISLNDLQGKGLKVSRDDFHNINSPDMLSM